MGTKIPWSLKKDLRIVIVENSNKKYLNFKVIVLMGSEYYK